MPERMARVAAVLSLHTPVRRYLPKTGATDSYLTAEAAFKEHLRDSMRGYESVPLDNPSQVPFFDICKECSRIENAAFDDGDNNADDGGVLVVFASTWPCPTFTAVTAAESASR